MQFTGKTVEEAVKAGLDFLELTEEQAEITVVNDAVKGLFGRVKSQAVVEITEKKKKAKTGKTLNEVEVLEKLLDLLKMPASIEKTEENGKEVLTLVSDKSSTVIGYRGEVLDALQTIVGAAANVGKKNYKKVVVDCENYRGRREETLINLAHKLEQKATEMKREVILESMSAFERRIIHTALAESETVTTRSDGKEPERYVVIVPNDKDEFSKPYNAGRNDKQRKGGRNSSKGGYNKKGGLRGRRSGGSGFTESKRVAPSGFGTYLGNSLKDNK